MAKKIKYVSPTVYGKKYGLTRVAVENQCRRGELKALKVYTLNRFYWAIPVSVLNNEDEKK